MNKRIEQLIKQASDFAEQIPYFRGMENGLTWEATIQKARDMKFAALIVQECASMARVFHSHEYDFTGDLDLDEFMLKHFGVEE